MAKAARDVIPRGAGIGFRSEIAPDLLRHPEAVDWVEVVVEGVLSSEGAQREAEAIAGVWPVVPHGIKCSLGSAEGVDPDRARRFAEVVRRVRAPCASEHLAYTRTDDTEIGHLTALPFTREAVAVVARNVAALRKAMPDVPLFLENAAWAFRYPDDEMDEGDFHHEVVRATGCKLLLDVANVYANALNSQCDPIALLTRYPLADVGMIHTAGGATRDGFRYDTHADPIEPAVEALLRAALAHTGRVPVVVERDANFPPAETLFAEVAACRAALVVAPEQPSRARTTGSAREASAPPTLFATQRTVTRWLTSDRPPERAETAGFDHTAVLRARAVLVDKRVDEAMPLLTSLAVVREGVRALAMEVVRCTPRGARAAAVIDALAIATHAREVPEWSGFAARDRAILRARFEDAGDGTMRPRRGIWMGFERSQTGRIWAFKGPGRGATVKLYETEGFR